MKAHDSDASPASQRPKRMTVALGGYEAQLLAQAAKASELTPSQFVYYAALEAAEKLTGGAEQAG